MVTPVKLILEESEAMSKLLRISLIAVLLSGILVSTSVALVGCGEETKTSTGGATQATQPTSNVIGDRAIKVLASNPTGGDYGANSITGTNLAKKLADPAEKAKLYLLDIRKKADFDKGHIEGAHQVEFAQWAAPDNLSKLPKDKKIIVICYTGNTAAQTTAGLRMLGYDAAVLRAGMNGWAANQSQAAVEKDLAAANYPVVTTPAEPSTPAPPGATFDKPSDSDYKVLAEKANQVFSSMPTEGEYNFFTITPAKLNEKLQNAAEKSKLFLLDIRKKEDFEKGHIEGATHVDFAAVAVPDNLKKLPKDKKIVVICYTGNTAAQATTILRMLDYDAVVLKYGMMGWDGSGKDAYLQEIKSANNPVVQ